MPDVVFKDQDGSVSLTLHAILPAVYLLRCDESSYQRCWPIGNHESYVVFHGVAILSFYQMFFFFNILDSTLLIFGIFELPIFYIWFLLLISHFLNFIIVRENVLSYHTACFGDD